MSQARVLTQQDLHKLLAHCATTRNAARNRCIVLLQHYAALRISEVAALKLHNVLHANGTLKDELRFTAAQVKEGRAACVQISPKLRAELQEFLGTISTKEHSAALIASGRTGTHFNVNALTQVVNALYKNAGIAGGSSHSGRRTAITRLANMNVPVRQLQAFARHANIATTQRYIDVNDEQLRAVVDML